MACLLRRVPAQAHISQARRPARPRRHDLAPLTTSWRAAVVRLTRHQQYSRRKTSLMNQQSQLLGGTPGRKRLESCTCVCEPKLAMGIAAPAPLPALPASVFVLEMPVCARAAPELEAPLRSPRRAKLHLGTPSQRSPRPVPPVPPASPRRRLPRRPLGPGPLGAPMGHRSGTLPRLACRLLACCARGSVDIRQVDP